jgi:hypothetical protein
MKSMDKSVSKMLNSLNRKRIEKEKAEERIGETLENQAQVNLVSLKELIEVQNAEKSITNFKKLIKTTK